MIERYRQFSFFYLLQFENYQSFYIYAEKELYLFRDG